MTMLDSPFLAAMAVLASAIGAGAMERCEAGSPGGLSGPAIVLAGDLVGAPFVGETAPSGLDAPLPGVLADPGPAVRDFVGTAPADPTPPRRGVEIGGAVPVEVPLVPVPKTDLGYAYIGGRTVLVDRTTRRIRQIVE